ncbi:hypothetical protein [Ideonella sp. B508-1]|uniref:DUF7674 family protein n=1 Tax=Ideonella sp. B508-1 TaxID=137716 RepID=UPI0003B5710B|nr:hypothetical protein [Ideonella sp. B508-1]
MQYVIDLYREVREHFPEAANGADLEHRRLGFEVDPEYACLWFGHLANALNYQMTEGVPFVKHEALFRFFSDAFSNGSDEVKECIDVSFVENLFWRVDMVLAQDYWRGLPQSLKSLYIGFHGSAP